jgi:hypothetical protein
MKSSSAEKKEYHNYRITSIPSKGLKTKNIFYIKFPFHLLDRKTLGIYIILTGQNKIAGVEK